MLARELLAAGLTGPPSDGELCRPFELGGVTDQNVVAHFNGASRRDGKSAPIVIVGAHYDAQGTDATGAVYPGADDNASGVAVLMEVARLVAARPEGFPCDLVLIAFGAEERGILGARAYVKDPTAPLHRVSLMINMDMVGRPFLEGNPIRILIGNADNALGYVVSTRGEGEAERGLLRAAKRTGTRLVGISESTLVGAGFLSDSVAFSAHTPTLLLSTSIHDDYHRPTDTAEKISVAQMDRTARLILEIIGAGGAGGGASPSRGRGP